jgi:oligoendopeptidase F
MVAPIRKFVPKSIDVSNWSQIEPLTRTLLERPLNSRAEVQQWLIDASELSSVVDEYGTRRYIEKSCHTDDPKMQAAFLQYIEQIEPKFKPVLFQLQKKYLASPHRPDGEMPKFKILNKKWTADVELFRDENVPLETEVTRQVNEYDKICGAMMVDFQGKQFTLQQMAKFLEEPKRELRQAAWEASSGRRIKDRDAIDVVFDKLMALRAKIAANAGLSDYRAFTFKSLKRFDYVPEDCIRFNDAIAKVCVPAVDELDKQRAADLGLARLRPWDMAVDPKNRPPLKPFREDRIDDFVAKTRQVFAKLSPELASEFDTLSANKNLDLDSRKGKQPGGYQSTLEEVRQPFIFMNAAGLQRDVETLLHEGGHAFHALAAANEDLIFLRSAPMEFCEVASMSMELLGAEHFGVFYSDAADANRARRNMLEGIIRFFPWMATIDSFQHWLYTHPGHTRQQRTAQWLALMERFGTKSDWSGWEESRASLWHRQLHVFGLPFYYVEYGIAQLGALQLWLKSKKDVKGALAGYRSALALGGTRPLPELFSTAGIKFDFSEQTLRPLIGALQEELARLPR